MRTSEKWKCREPSQKKIGSCEGTIRSLRARLTGALLKPGKPYSPKRIQAATGLLKQEVEPNKTILQAR